MSNYAEIEELTRRIAAELGAPWKFAPNAEPYPTPDEFCKLNEDDNA